MSLSKEAAVIVTTVTGLIGTVVTLLVVFGVDLSTEQQAAIGATATAFLTAIFLVGPIIRQFVFSKDSTQELVDKAYKTTPGTAPKPQVKL